MVQTKLGAERNPWVEYMKLCAEHYRAGYRAPPQLPFHFHFHKEDENENEDNNEKQENVTTRSRRNRRNRRNKTKSPTL